MSSPLSQGHGATGPCVGYCLAAGYSTVTGTGREKHNWGIEDHNAHVFLGHQWILYSYSTGLQVVLSRQCCDDVGQLGLTLLQLIPFRMGNFLCKLQPQPSPRLGLPARDTDFWHFWDPRNQYPLNAPGPSASPRNM